MHKIKDTTIQDNTKVSMDMEKEKEDFLKKIGLLLQSNEARQQALQAKAKQNGHQRKIQDASACSGNMPDMPAVKSSEQPWIPLLRRQETPSSSSTSASAGSTSSTPPQQKLASGKRSLVICEICDGYLEDLAQLCVHIYRIHKVDIYSKLLENRPPINCHKCQFGFFTDIGLERHLLGYHGRVTSSLQAAAIEGQDSGRCPLCGKGHQSKLLAHIAGDHNVPLEPTRLSYKCKTCSAKFETYKLYEAHVCCHSALQNLSVTKNTPCSDNQQEQIPSKVTQLRFIHPNKKVSIDANRSGQFQSNKRLKIDDQICGTALPIPNTAQALRHIESLAVRIPMAPIQNIFDRQVQRYSTI